MKGLYTVLALALAAWSFAVDSTAEASQNATVQPGGPRTGNNGINFFNVEGSANGNFASFGVADFTSVSFGFAPGSLASVNSATLQFTQSNAAFTTPGTIHFYFATNTTVSIANDPSLSPLRYNNANGANANGVDNQLGTLIDLGTGAFTASGSTGTGTVDMYTLTLNASAQNYLLNALNSPTGIIRLVAAAEEPGSATAAATWAGATHSSLAGPTLTVGATPVPEPATVAIVSLGALGMLRRRRGA